MSSFMASNEKQGTFSFWSHWMTNSLMGLNQDGENSCKKSARNTTEIVPHDFCKKACVY